MIGFGCPTAEALFEDYAGAIAECFEAADKLCNVVALYDQVAVAKRQTEQACDRCEAARLKFQKHRAEHRCSLNMNSRARR
jgi:hypothetical protein